MVLMCPKSFNLCGRKELADRGHIEDGVEQGQNGRTEVNLLDNLFLLISPFNISSSVE
jgi:hypothetical protein